MKASIVQTEGLKGNRDLTLADSVEMLGLQSINLVLSFLYFLNTSSQQDLIFGTSN
jgi:hypothetical protein